MTYIELQFACIEPHYSKFAIILLEYFQLRKVRANFVGEKTWYSNKTRKAMYWTLYYYFIFSIVTSVKVRMEPHYNKFAIRTFRALYKINRQYCSISWWGYKVFETIEKIFVQHLNWYNKYKWWNVRPWKSTNWELSDPANFTNCEMSGLRNVRLPCLICTKMILE